MREAWAYKPNHPTVTLSPRSLPPVYTCPHMCSSIQSSWTPSVLSDCHRPEKNSFPASGHAFLGGKIMTRVVDPDHVAMHTQSAIYMHPGVRCSSVPAVPHLDFCAQATLPLAPAHDCLPPAGFSSGGSDQQQSITRDPPRNADP